MPPHLHKSGDGPGEEDAARLGGRAGDSTRGGDFGVRGTVFVDVYGYTHTPWVDQTNITHTPHQPNPHTPPNRPKPNHPHRAINQPYKQIQLVLSAPPALRLKAMRLVASKVALAARMDAYQQHARGTEGGLVLVIYLMDVHVVYLCLSRTGARHIGPISDRRRNPNTSQHDDDDDHRGGRAVAARGVRGQDREVAGAAQG